MTESQATGYDWLSSRPVPQTELRTFLLECFAIAEDELFVGHADRTDDELRAYPPDAAFAAFCTYDHQVSGHFAMSLSVGIEGRLADQVGRREFAERFAARFDAYVLYGDTEPPGLWTVILPDGSRLRAALEEDDVRCVLYAATAPVPGLPQVRVDEGLWQIR
ncbi:hypothetical protein [Actinomadura miaoliensis]|uniref:hypothetical protein n=1 Tax=Actinomadura miaoliensis TaxID=430685 RepID=UPI0031ECBF6B